MGPVGNGTYREAQFDSLSEGSTIGVRGRLGHTGRATAAIY